MGLAARLRMASHALTVSAEVLADAPWGFWEQAETSGTTLADSSGNARSMTISGSSHTLNQTGPSAALVAIAWANAAGYAVTAVTVDTSDVTMEAWVYLTANPSAGTAITGHAIAFDNGTRDKTLYVDTSGRACMHFYSGSSIVVTASAPLSLNAWHHVIGSVGAAGAKIRVDKITVGTNAATTSAFGFNQLVFIRGGGSGFNGNGAMKIAMVARYTSQLSDARTDAHYDAGMA